MANETATDTAFFHIKCDEVLDISSVAEFHARCLGALKKKQNIMLNASQVDRADTAALQVLSAFIQDANSGKQIVQWEAPSEPLCQSAALLGLSDMLCLPTVMDSSH